MVDHMVDHIVDHMVDHILDHIEETHTELHKIFLVDSVFRTHRNSTLKLLLSCS